jgi:hypothetical protein
MTSHLGRIVQQFDAMSDLSYDARAELIAVGSAAPRHRRRPSAPGKLVIPCRSVIPKKSATAM